MNLTAINAATNGKTRTSGVSPFMELQIELVYPNPDQPRKKFTPESLKELAADIKKHGLLQPIVVVKTDRGYMIVNGERRWRAHHHNEATTILSHIVKADDHKVLELALLENIQREDLTDFEIAKSIGKLWSSNEYASKSELAIALSKSPSYISKALAVLKLDEEIITDIETNKADASLEVLQELSRVPDKELQKELYEKNATREEIRAAKEIKPKKISPAKKVIVCYGLGIVNKNMGNMQEILLQKDDVIFNGTIRPIYTKNFQEDKKYKITIEEV